MSKLLKARTAQYPLTASFTFSYGDTMVNTAGAEVAFNVTGSPIFKIVPLPPGAVVVGGEVVVETAYNTTGTATVSVGDATSATRYANAVNAKSAARTALTLTGFRSTGEDVQLTLALADTAATQGKVTVNLTYIQDGRANEVHAN
jgi:hypothetical protein